MALDDIQMHILQEVADLHTIPEGAYNIRSNGSLAGRNTTANIDITSKPNRQRLGRLHSHRDLCRVIV